MLFAPLEGWRHVEVTDRHAAVDYAQILRDLYNRHFPDAARIVLVKDNYARLGWRVPSACLWRWLAGY